MRRQKTVLFLWLLISCTGVTFAQQPASQQRGLAADTAYQIGEIDHINLFNGGLTLRIPMGSSYPVGPNLSLGLTLTYSSNGWDYDDAVCTDMNGTHRYHVPVPSPHTNAGFGWRILPGKIYPDPDGPRTSYISGDGGEHGLYTELHPGYPAAGAQPDTWFTSDATYLRVRHYSSGTGVCTAATGGSSDCYQVEFPDGTVHELHDFSGVSGETLWLVTRMMDRFEHDHFVAIDYGTANEWRISDSHGRNHKVVFSGGKIARVELEAFDTATPAVTTLTHVDTAIDRQNFFPPDCDATPLQITVPLLTQVTLPDGSAFKMSYETESSSSKLSGSIESLRLPTGGEVAWEYERLDFVSQDPDLNGPEYARTSYAVSKKEMFTTFGLPATKIGEWNYDYRTLVGPDNPRAATDQNAVPCFHTVTVTDPLGHATVNYFDSASPGVSRWQYGLPFRRCDGSGNLLSPPFLSQEIYDGDTDTGTRLRAIYVDYDSDGRNAGQQQEKNHRLKLRRVEYDDDPGRFKQVEHSDFDGLGHFRTMTASGNFDGGESRTSTTRFNPSSGTLLLDPENSVPVAGNSFAMPAQSAPWVLGTFDLQTVSEAGDTATSEFCFDTDTGFLERTRVRAGTDRSGVDLLRVFDEEEISGNGTGRVATERSYGGDPGSLGTGSLCSLSLPTEPQSQMEHTYAFGVLASSSYVEPCDDSLILRVADHDIDSHTGRIKISRDSAGVATRMRYDAMGRRVREEPAASAWTLITYDLPGPSSTDPPDLTVVQCPNGATSCAALSYHQSVYDGLGRLKREIIQYPDASGIGGSAREFTYDGMSRKIRESMWDDFGFTTEFSHDRFGRVTEIRLPDSSLAPTLIRYRGEQRIDRSDKVATEAGAEHYVCTREEVDAFGRLVQVNEDRASSGDGECQNNTAAGLVTTYDYDESDRLVKVCNIANGSSCGQERFFNYDNRGFLTSEQHPEIGPSGNGLTHYSYDASGNLLSQDIAGSNDFSLRYRYDNANRLIAIDELLTPPSTVRPLKSFHYARGNVGGDLRAGKLVLAKRINWVDIVDPLRPANSGIFPITLSQAYRYEGRDGRVSKRQTRYNFGEGHYLFDTGFEYDQQGNVSRLTYPTCLHAECGGAGPARNVDFNYTRGYLSSIPGYANHLYYQLGGMFQQVSHANGVVETVEHAFRNLPRPARITTSGTTTGDSGAYEYDGAGNIKSIGNQAYVYDRMSRLEDGQVEIPGEVKSQTLTYDSYGNLTSLTTDGAILATPVNTATNRLANATYDAGGNLTGITLGGEAYKYTYDPLNMMKHLQSSGDQARIFIYDADDERIFTFDCVFADCQTQDDQLTATLRGLDGKVLRVFQLPFGEGWQWQRDYVYRDGLLLAAVEPKAGGGEKRSYLHLDHLGTPRQITDESGSAVALHSYYPFGGEATDPSQDEVELKFTGHERDGNGSDGAGMLDYMHARYCSPELGRFSSVDPLRRYSASRSPQSWNRYSYVANNPMGYTDPDGQKRLKSVNIIWSRFSHFVKRHVRKNGFEHKTKFRTNDPQRAKKLVEKTIRNPDRTTIQRRDHVRLVRERRFDHPRGVGEGGEQVVRTVTEPRGGDTEKFITGFAVKDFLASALAFSFVDLLDADADFTDLATAQALDFMNPLGELESGAELFLDTGEFLFYFSELESEPAD